MPIMIPDEISTDTPESEKIIFETLKHTDYAGARDWVVFHSVHVDYPPGTATPREIDFVILNRRYCSVICMEVKGGYYNVSNRQWYRASSTAPLNSPPPDQAKTAMWDLKMASKRGSLSFGCAVAFTDMNISGDIPKSLALLIGADNARDPVELSKHLEDYAEKLSVKNRDDLQAQIDLENLQSELEGHVVMEPRLRPDTIFRQDLESLRPQLLRLTAEQKSSLDIARLNPRCVFDGAAGTGKTVLAMELARQHCEEGETVGLLCSNPILNVRFRRWADKLSNASSGTVVAGTPVTLPFTAFKGNRTLMAKHRQRRVDSPDLEKSLKFGHLAPKWEPFIDETVKDLGQKGFFDYLIVDEAQNLCDEMFLKLMNALLKDGLADGRWAMFGDFVNQNIVSRDLKGMEVLDKFYPARASLQTNCRNTHEIAAAVAKFVDIDSPPISGVHGPLVQLEYFGDQTDLGNLLDRLVNSLKGRDFQSQQIILLSYDTGEEFDTERRYGGWSLKNIDRGSAKGKDPILVQGGQDNTLRYSDVYDFQGLESEVAILVLPITKRMTRLAGSVSLPNFEHLRKVLYIGMSRAKAMLIIVADESYKRFLEPPGL